MNKTALATRKAYARHKWGANDRGIQWLFTFDTWCEVWEKSGKWNQRGRGKNQYCMCRKGPDIGPYSPDNVYIDTNAHNTISYNKMRPEISTEGRKSNITNQPNRIGVRIHGVEYPSLGQAGKALSVNWMTIKNRIEKGMPGYEYI